MGYGPRFDSLLYTIITFSNYLQSPHEEQIAMPAFTLQGGVEDRVDSFSSDGFCWQF